jgi:hypothetical protein
MVKSGGAGTIVILALGVSVLVVYSMTPSYKDETPNNPILSQVRANFVRLDPKFAKIPLRTGDSAYTENKEVITLCLTDPDTNRNYDINTIMYVSLHELAHCITSEDEDEHGPAFKQNFSKLLIKASDEGIYNPRIPIPATYCKVGTR